MRKEFNDEITSLADVLQITVDMHSRDNSTLLTGGRLFKLPLSSAAGEDADLHVRAKIEGSFVAEGSAAVLVHLKGRLFVYLSCTKEDKSSSYGDCLLDLRILDAGKGGVRMLRIAAHDVSIGIARKLLKPYTKAVFKKTTKDVQWKAVDGKAYTVVKGNRPQPVKDVAASVEGNGCNV